MLFLLHSLQLSQAFTPFYSIFLLAISDVTTYLFNLQLWLSSQIVFLSLTFPFNLLILIIVVFRVSFGGLFVTMLWGYCHCVAWNTYGDSASVVWVMLTCRLLNIMNHKFSTFLSCYFPSILSIFSLFTLLYFHNCHVINFLP